MIQKPFNSVTLDPQRAPEQVVAIDAKLRAAENARLRAKYKAVDNRLLASWAKSLDLATERMMKRPDLALRLVTATRS
jgi:hypothetical protein